MLTDEQSNTQCSCDDLSKRRVLFPTRRKVRVAVFRGSFNIFIIVLVLFVCLFVCLIDTGMENISLQNIPADVDST